MDNIQDDLGNTLQFQSSLIQLWKALKREDIPESAPAPQAPADAQATRS